MKIGIDARFVGPQGTGLGKYTEKLITSLAKIDQKNSYTIFLKKNNWDYLNLSKFANFKKVLADISWYTLEEQIKLPKIFSKENLDLLHIPHFNAPVFYQKKFIVTIHDLIHHYFREQTATSKTPLIFLLKRLSYKVVINIAVRRSKKILVPSNFIKNQVANNFKVNKDKIIVTYEAAEEEYYTVRQTQTTQQLLDQYKIREPFIIYVGNAYPHKNLEKLLDAIYLINDINLVVVCPRDIFASRLSQEITKRNLSQRVNLTGYLPADILSQLFQKAQAYVFPSLSEGFGIPGLNAMVSKLPVIASSIPTLEEIYGEAALYFDPENPYDIAEKIKEVLTFPKLKKKLVASGIEQVKKYSWQKMAQETLKVYNESQNQ